MFNVPATQIVANRPRRRLVTAALLLLAGTVPSAGAQTVTLLPTVPFHNAGSVWGTSPTDLWTAGGIRGIANYDGVSWTADPVTTGFNRYTITGTGTGTLYSAGQLGYQSGALLRSNGGGSWNPVFTTSTELVGLWAGADGSVLVGGDGRFFYSPDGNSFFEAPTGLSSAFNTDRLQAIWGRTASDAYVAGRGGLYRWDGSTFDRVDAPASNLAAVHYSGSSWWAVGSGGQVWNGTGNSWSRVDMGVTLDALGVWAFSDQDVWVSGASGMLRHFDGVSWRSVASGTTNALLQLYAVDEQTLFVGSYSDPGQVRRVDIARAVPEPTSLALLAVGVAGLAARRRRRSSREPRACV